jgi:hypothetical protein
MADESKTPQQTGKPDEAGAFKQAREQALSPEQKHKNYLDDLERLHKESVVDATGHTPRAG